MVVVDLDGTVLDIHEHHYACYVAILDERGYRALPRSRYWALKRQGIRRNDILAETGADRIDGPFLTAWLERIESRAYLELDRLLPGARSTLDAWAADGRRPTLVTARRNEATLRWQLEHLGLDECFIDVVRAEHDGQPCFKGRAFRASQPDTAVEAWIGDSEDDIHAARHVGATAIAVTSGLRDRRFLEHAAADTVVDGLAAASQHHGLARPDGAPSGMAAS